MASVPRTVTYEAPPVHTILLVDDNPRLAPLVTRLLSVLGFHYVGIASDAAAARVALTSMPIALVICDMRLPGEDGLSLLRWTRRNAETRGVPFIVTEESFTFEEVIRADELGADGVLLKPYQSDFFRTKITSAVSGAARRRGRNGNQRETYEVNQTFAQSLWGVNENQVPRG